MCSLRVIPSTLKKPEVEDEEGQEDAKNSLPEGPASPLRGRPVCHGSYFAGRHYGASTHRIF
jgi:hypothetical protein